MSDPQSDLKQWLADCLKAKGHGAKKGLAQVLEFPSPDRVTRMLPNAKEPRRIQPHEIEPMARFFKSLPPGFGQMTLWLDGGSAPTTGPTTHFSETIRETKGLEYSRPLKPTDVAEPIKGEVAIRSALGRFVGLSPKNVDQLVSEVLDMIEANAAESRRSKSRDQSEPSSRRHARAP